MPCAVGSASAADAEDCAASTLAFTGASCISASKQEGATCPDGCQAKIDSLYSDCGGLDEGGVDWDAQVGTVMKTSVENVGCAGAAQTVPAIFAAASMLVAHFLN